MNQPISPNGRILLQHSRGQYSSKDKVSQALYCYKLVPLSEFLEAAVHNELRCTVVHVPRVQVFTVTIVAGNFKQRPNLPKPKPARKSLST